jgi:hypothetical protein
MIILLAQYTVYVYRNVPEVDKHTAWNRALLDKPTVTHLLKKFVACYGTKM